MRTLFIILTLAFSLSARAQIAGLVTVRPDGSIWPSNTVATINTLANNAAGVQAAIAEAQANELAATMVSNSVAEIKALERARNATGYIRLFAESFSPGIEADTNLQASIVRFDQNVAVSNNLAWHRIWTYFTSDPGAWPYVRSSDSLGRTNAWDALESASVSLGEVLVGSTLYEAYCNTVSMPLNTTSAFFRVHADIQGSGTNQMYFPVNNGIAVNGVAPLTATFTQGTNVMQWIGGVRVR